MLANVPLVTTAVPICGRAWQITAVQNQDLLLDAAEDFEHFPFGLLLWESAIALAGVLAAEPVTVAGRSVLELGCGVGLPGIVARSLGAAVQQTDHQRDALLLAEQNARQNGVSGISRFLADWRTWSDDDRCDVILGADITYDRPMHFYLEAIFNRCLAPGGTILLTDPGRPQTLEFAAHLEKRGWTIGIDTLAVEALNSAETQQTVEVTLLRLCMYGRK